MHVFLVQLKEPMSDRKAYLEAEAKRLQKAIDDGEEQRRQKAERQRDKGLKTRTTSKDSSKKHGCRSKGFLIIAAVIFIVGVALIAMVATDENVPASPPEPSIEITPTNVPTTTDRDIDNASSADERIDLKIEKARQTLSTRGSVDHKSALNYLYILGEDLDKLDLSCRTLGLWNSNTQTCALRPNFLNTSLVGTQADPRDLSDGNFAHVDFGYSNFMHSNLSNSDFDSAILQYANLSQTTLEDTNFMRSDLTNAKFDGADLENANFQHANISGARFFGVSNLTTSMLSDAWTWSDNPPIGIPNRITGPMVCDASRRETYKAGRNIGLPADC
tara:strand:+ start:1141 stop:2136 length:996 start_codon:yes stop_codon:yes gene_type:complete